MHPLHDYVAKQLADKLKERRVVVRYDERGEFRPFASGRPGGLGLGLPMAAKLVRLHAGQIVLRNAATGGAEAIVRLPLGGPAGRNLP